MKRKRKVKKKVIVLLVLILLLIALVVGVIMYTNSNKKTDSSSKKVVDEIPEYGYVLDNNKTKLYKNLFKKLAEVLGKDDVDYDEYAKLVSELAVSDFYTLDNKTSKNDIGGVQFIRKDNRENFVLEASETVYKYVEQNLDGKRNEELPIVSKIEVTDTKQEAYKYKDISDDKAYVIKVKLEYKKDLGYPEEVEVRLLHSDKKLEIYSMK